MRRPSPPRASAFAPAGITNFFSVSFGRDGKSLVGATGGGYILSEGVTSEVTFLKGEGDAVIIVDGDRGYDARTTRRAIELVLALAKRPTRLEVTQTSKVPVGYGFGASAASALSAVIASAAALGVRDSKEALATLAHAAEIAEKTGVGTVSVIYALAGAVAVTAPGPPGTAALLKVRSPRGTRIVTASVAPYDKRLTLSSERAMRKTNSLGDEALARFLQDPTLDNLGAQGERFSRALGLETAEVRKLEAAAKRAGAAHASQNMIGYAVHAVADEDSCRGVAAALRRTAPSARVDVFRLGSTVAGLVSGRRRALSAT